MRRPIFFAHCIRAHNLYTTSVIAGRQNRNHAAICSARKKDFHDWDMMSPPALIRTAGGRQIAAAAGKNGILYAIDRSGVAPGSKSSQAPLKIVYATPVTTRSNVKEPFNTKTETRFCPGTQGGAEWNGPALHPPSNLLLVNAVDWCASVKVADAGMVTGKRGSIWPGSGDPENPFGRSDPKEMWGGWLTAIAPIRDACVGSTNRPRPCWRRSRPPRGAWSSPGI
jgi:alcohol dehydrogenase (cytochrome c)